MRLYQQQQGGGICVSRRVDRYGCFFLWRDGSRIFFFCFPLSHVGNLWILNLMYVWKLFFIEVSKLGAAASYPEVNPINTISLCSTCHHRSHTCAQRMPTTMHCSFVGDHVFTQKILAYYMQSKARKGIQPRDYERIKSLVDGKAFIQRA